MESDAKFDEKVLALIAEAVPGRMKKKQLTPDLRLQKDLGLDSLGMAALVFRLEEAFGIELGDLVNGINIGQMKTVADALQASRQLVTQARAARSAA